MKKKSTSRSAFFNLRVLFGLLVGMTGVSLALFAANPLGRGPTSPTKPAKAQQKYNVGTKSSSLDPLALPPGFDCSKIHDLHIDVQENFRAQSIMIACGLAEGGKPSPPKAFSKFVKSLLPHPLAYGAVDVDLITGTETFPHVTQSETFSTANPDNPNEIVVAYNDSKILTPPFGGTIWNISGASVSEDGGNTFTRLTVPATDRSPFDNTLGDPVMLYNKQSATWFAIWLDVSCGPQGIGYYKSTTPSDPTSWTHGCIHNGSFDDRESGWADNNPSSPHYGNMYVSWNDFTTSCGAGGCLFETFSSDGGTTWSTPVEVQTNTSFFSRDVQITGDDVTGDVYIASMDEGGGGFPHDDTNYIYKSIDGGVSWTNPYIGTPFPGPGVCASGYFAGMFSTNGCYWRHEGWGEPAAHNGIVHLVYDQHGTGSDPADVYYIRSTDGGSTFGTPVKLNTDTTDRPQWQPNLSVSPTGSLLATWYDARVSADSDCVYGSPTSPCYQMFSRKSNDNGQSWLLDDTLSDVVSPLPAQPDGDIQGTYVGDYDYGSAILGKQVTSWADGRVAINSTSQQDAFTDRELVGFSVTTTDPQCGSLVTGTAPTDFVVDLSDPADPSTVQASDFTVNGTPADSDTLNGDNTEITFHFNSSPVTPGVNTMHIAAGAIHQASNNDPILEFDCTFRYTQVQLAVTDTDPPVGGTFTPPAPSTYNYVVNWNAAVDESSVQDTDLQLSGNAGGTVTGHSFSNGDTTITFTLSIPFGGSLTAHIAAGAITDTDGNPNADFSGNYTVSGCPPSQYVITEGTDTIVPGTTDTGNHQDDGDTLVPLPFTFQLYDQTYNAVNVSSNGRVDFVCVNEAGGYVSACLPPPPNQCPYDYTIFGVWQDLMTLTTNSGCSTWANGCGIFTTVEGTAPNRIFDIEWHAVLFFDTTQAVNFEVRLFEGDPNLKFEVVYGAVSPNGTTHPYVGGVQGNSGAGFFTQDFCGATPPQNVSRTYEIPPCASPTPTPTPGTPTPTPTPGTPTPTPTATPTATPAHSATPRPRPTPHPRPTP